ncbi:hypothetical protein QQF64_016645 [Cirrhinus molitorella]|uniref:Uncharacterized protein n=1 Tax=Cirrhinus molitorella TaxID=172907 RepID=A0ABR3LQQ8_9TELE
MDSNSNSSLATRKEPLSEVGFEPTPPFGDQKSQQLRRLKYLESGALDHSAILTLKKYVIDNYHWSWLDGKMKYANCDIYCLNMDSNSNSSLATRKEPLSEVGFEPTPPFGDRNLNN